MGLVRYKDRTFNDSITDPAVFTSILLLDEADVFLSQRETSALQRNALVSVFLRYVLFKATLFQQLITIVIEC